MRTNVRLAARTAADPYPAFDTAFARAVLTGLSYEHKSIPRTWLYDQNGCELFDRVMQLPQYYPARTESLILSSCAEEIADLVGPAATLIELISGSSPRAPLLLTALDRPAPSAMLRASTRGNAASRCIW
jgi:L-histidine Nalpha-methyltransferase